MITDTGSSRVVYSNDEFESQGFWPARLLPLFDRRKKFSVLTPFGWFAVCAAGAVVMGGALAFAT